MAKLLLIDLFSASGGWSRGFTLCRLADCIPALAVDSDQWAIGAYKLNFPQAKALRQNLQFMETSEAYALYRRYLASHRNGHTGVVLLASPPCESFSDAAATRRRRDDERNYLFRSVLTWAKATRPLAVFAENVPQMARLHSGALHAEFVNGLEALGYLVRCEPVNALDFGVPQRRLRLFYAAIRADLGVGAGSTWPRSTHGRADQQPTYVTAREAMHDLPERVAGGGGHVFLSKLDPDTGAQRLGYYAASLRPPIGAPIYHHLARPLGSLNRQRVRALDIGEAMEDLPKPLRPKMGFPGSYGRLDPDKPAFTLTSHFGNPGSGRYFHYAQDRLITPREGARLQGFPDVHRFYGYWDHITEQIGDAVPPPLAHAFAHALAIDLITAGVVERPDAPSDRHCVFRHLEVPGAKHLPSNPSQSTVGKPVTSPVAANLGVPIVAGDSGTVLPTVAVPERAIDEDRKARLCEGNVRPTGKMPHVDAPPT